MNLFELNVSSNIDRFISRLFQVEDAVMLSDKLLGYGVELVQSVVVQVAVTGRKDIAFAHLDS